MKPGRGHIFVSILVLSCCAVFLPAFLGLAGMFHDDHAFDVFTKYFFLAKALKAGYVPLWDPHTWCGAVPLFARYYSETWYLPLWPILLISNLGYKSLVLVPALLHFIIAALGIFYLLKLRARIQNTGACAAALLYILSPTMTYAYGWHQVLYLQAWTPWLLLLSLKASDGFNPFIYCAAALVCSFTITAASPGIWFVPIIACGGALTAKTLLALIRKDKKGAGDTVLAGLFIALAGAGLSAVYLFGFIEGMPFTSEHINLGAKDALLEPGGSLRLSFFSTLFAPNLFGNLTGETFANLYPEPLPVYWDANLMGGIFVCFSALCAVICAFGIRVQNHDEYKQKLFSFGLFLLFVFSLLCVLGRNSFFYGSLISRIPFLGQLPRPVRYRYFECFSLSALAGIGINYLLTTGRVFIRERLRPALKARWFSAFALCVCVLAMALPFKEKTTLKRIWDGFANTAKEGSFAYKQLSPATRLAPGQAATEKTPLDYRRPGPFADNAAVKKICAVRFWASGAFKGSVRWQKPLTGNEHSQPIQTSTSGWQEIKIEIPKGATVTIETDETDKNIRFGLFRKPLRYAKTVPTRQSLFFRLELEEKNTSAFSVLKHALPGHKTVTSNIVYLVIAVLGLCLIAGLEQEKFAALLCAAVIIEASVFAWAPLYRAEFSCGLPAPNHIRATGPQNQPLVRTALAFFGASEKSQLFRKASSNPFTDNFSRTSGSFALMGYEMHPIETRFKRALERAYSRPVNYFIYYADMVPQQDALRFLSNFSVSGFLHTDKEKIFGPDSEVLPVQNSKGWFMHKNPSALPRVYFNGNIELCSDTQALKTLCTRNLAGRVCIEKDFAAFVPKEKTSVDFETLNRENKIVGSDFSNPNRILLTVEAKHDSLLVMTDVWFPGWKARVDGNIEKVLRVNYCQRGLRIEKGRREIEIFFSPESSKKGLLISGITAGLMMLLLTVAAIKRNRASC